VNTKCVVATLAVLLSAWSSFAKEPADGDGKVGQKQYVAAPDAAWDAAFTRTSGWTGGDVAGTVDLGDGRVVWLFGDTWIGDVADGRHKPGARMVNNSIAIQSLAGKPSELPAKSDLRLYWQGGSKDPSAWIAPKLEQTAAGGKQSDPKASQGWYWPSGGGAVAPGPGGRPRLAIFLFHIGKQQGQQGVWAFKSLGSAMALVDNLADGIEKWEVPQFDIPFAVGTDAVKKEAKLREISWGVAACRYRPAENQSREWLYIYGIRNEAPLNRQVILARANVDSPSRFEEWQFYAGKDKWSATMADLAPIAEHVTNELSVERLPGARQPTWIMVHSEPPFGRKIFVRTAARPEGPWTDPTAVYSVPEVDRNSAYFAYAAKGHLDLSRPDELLITYVVNAHDFGAMAKDAGIYRPRFIRVPLKAFLPPGKDGP
jgi:hypothetical protein